MRTKLAAIVSILLIAASGSSQIANDDSGVGNALGTRSMEYCESSANTSPHKQEQLDFLGEHKVQVLDEGKDSYWLDHPVKHPESDMSIYVRYFAGKNATRPCTFGLVTILNHPEVGKDMARYTHDNKPYQLDDNDRCRGNKPPTIKESGGIPRVTLNCDIIT